MNFEQNGSCDQNVITQILQSLYYFIFTLGEKPNRRKNPKNQTKKQLPKMEIRNQNHFLIYIVEMMTQIPAPYLLDLDFLNQNLNHMFHHEKVLTEHVK